MPTPLRTAFLAGKTALITGSTSGIGAAYATALAGAGANVVINGFGDAAAIEVQRAALAEASGAGESYSNADLTDVAATERMVADAADRFGGIDILINNAGTQHVAPVDEFPVGKWDLILAVNLSSVFHTTRLALPYMKAKGWGRLIATASAHSLTASPFKSAYVAAKHGVAGFQKTVALEVAQAGITANAISPGYVWTSLVEGQIPDTMKARGMTRDQVINDVLLEKQPTKQFVTPRTGCGFGPVSVPRRSGGHHRREPLGRWRLDRTMKRALLVLTLLAGCSGTPRPAPAPAVRGWTGAITTADVHRAHDWRTAFTRGLAQARAAGHGAEITAEGALLQPDAALAEPTLPDGSYKCRVIKLGTQSSGMLPYIAYPAFDCAVTGSRLAKLNGSQRQAGTLYPDTAMRMIFLGTLALGDETMARPYGVDPERDIFGTVERIGPNRWRLVMPYPRYESLIDILELIPTA